MKTQEGAEVIRVSASEAQVQGIFLHEKWVH